MLVKIVLLLVAVVIVIAVIAAMRPDDFRMLRTARINASPSVVFAEVNDLHKWQNWSPWAKMDPNAKTTFSGSAAGTNAAMSWDGNMNVGQGTMTITESKPAELIRFRIDFMRPFKGTNTAEFDFKAEGNQTVVTWSMSGKNNFMSKIVGLFMNCEKMVGNQFDQGLTDLKAVAEKNASNSN